VAQEFKYEARNKKGERVSGTLKAETEDDAARQLQNRDCYIVSIKKLSSGLDFSKYMPDLRRTTISDIAVFSRQLSVLVSAGFPLIEALELVSEQIDNKKMIEITRELVSMIERGESFYDALGEYPDVFPDLFREMIKIGETSGKLESILLKLSQKYEDEMELRSKIKSALTYPILVVVVAVLVFIFLLTNVVPVFANMFSGLGAELPLITQIVLQVSDFVADNWWIITLVFLSLFLILSGYFKTPRGKYVKDYIVLKIPMVGGLFRKIGINRFASTLALLGQSGVSLYDSLRVIEDLIGNTVLASAIIDARAQLREGVNISLPLKESGEFPEFFINMLVMGEETGAIDDMLLKAADVYEYEVNDTIESLVSLVEPLMIIMIAIVVGVILLAILMPMFTMFEIIV